MELYENYLIYGYLTQELKLVQVDRLKQIPEDCWAAILKERLTDRCIFVDPGDLCR